MAKKLQLFLSPRAIVKKSLYTLYERRLGKQARTWEMPRHIGIIMDGNRRFAREQHNRDISWGHRHGADKLEEMLEWCIEFKINCVTVWGFSSDNFQRSPKEVESLLNLFQTKTHELITSETVHKYRVRIRYIGQIDRFNDELRRVIAEVEAATKQYDGPVLNIALAYGGREEIVDAFRGYLFAQEKAGNNLEEARKNLDIEAIEKNLYTAGLPEPDLIIRTSGEIRLSGFLLWQSAKSEFHFCDTHWPGFRKTDFLRALRSYCHRNRRFGK